MRSELVPPEPPSGCRGPSALAPCERGGLEILPARVPEIRNAIRPPERGLGVYVGTLDHRGSRQEKTCRARAPKRRTGVPDKNYRGPQQGFPYLGRPLTTTIRANKPKTPCAWPRDNVTTMYRGPQQVLPGSPTSATGVPDKNYRGPQQGVLAKDAAKRGILGRVSWSLCFCFSCSVMLLNNNYRENGEVYPWGQVASS